MFSDPIYPLGMEVLLIAFSTCLILALILIALGCTSSPEETEQEGE